MFLLVGIRTIKLFTFGVISILTSTVHLIYEEVIDERVRNVHDCKMNQIVPQVMIGNILCNNDEHYIPSYLAKL